MFVFRNIDSFQPKKFERVGMLKGKRWYLKDSKYNKPELGLFKPKRYEFKDKKVFCANHYGEFIGYLLAHNSSTPACPVELAKLTKYYENIFKERNGGTPEEKKGCISYSLLTPDESLEAGNVVIDIFRCREKEKFDKITKNEKSFSYDEDNLELFLASVESRTQTFYEDYYKRYKNQLPPIHQKFGENISEEYIKNKIDENRKLALQTIVYDCLYGNNDRHIENWSMVTKYKFNRADMELYPLYDNERVLGLYENQHVIENALKNNDVENISDKILYSRMKVPMETKRTSTYKDVLQYLMEHYPEEVSPILKLHLEKNTPAKINEFLTSCEGLPSCYVDFGNIMYRGRYDFATKLLERTKTKQAEEQQR